MDNQTVINQTIINKITPNDSWVSASAADKAFKSEYNRQAIEFLHSTNTICAIERIGESYPDWDSKNLHDEYKVTLTNSKGSLSFNYFDSVIGTKERREGKGGRKYDFYSALACLETYTTDSFDGFISDYGYTFKNETEYIKIKSVHLECIRQCNVLRKMYSEEELERLGEIR